MRRTPFFVRFLFGILLSAGSAFLAPAGTERSALPEPVRVFVEHCYEANRLTGTAKPPENEPNWARVPPSARKRLNLPEDPAVEAYMRTDLSEDRFLILEIHERALKDAPLGFPGLSRNSCRVSFSSAVRRKGMYEALVTVFDGIEGQEKVGVANDCGYEPPPKWDQWLWMAMPESDAEKWKIYSYNGKQSTCIRFTQRADYSHKDLIGIRMLFKEDDPNLYTIKFDRTFDRDEKDGES